MHGVGELVLIYNIYTHKQKKMVLSVDSIEKGFRSEYWYIIEILKFSNLFKFEFIRLLTAGDFLISDFGIGVKKLKTLYIDLKNK